MPAPAFAELHVHTSFSFLDGASAPADLVQRAAELGLAGLAVTDSRGLYGVVRFAAAAAEVGLHAVIGAEVELADALVPDPHGLVVPARRRSRRDMVGPWSAPETPVGGLPARPRPDRARLPGHRQTVKEDLRGIGTPQRGPHLVLLARDDTGYRSLCRLISRANLGGTKGSPGSPRRSWRPTWKGWSPCQGVVTASSPGACSRAIERAPGTWRERMRARSGRGCPATLTPGSSSSCRITSSRTTTGWWVRPSAWPTSSACRSSSPTTSTTPARRTASSTTSSPRSATAGHSRGWPTCGRRAVSTTSSRRSSWRRCPPATRRSRAPRRPGRGPRDWPTPVSWPRPAPSISGSSSTASRASRCRPARHPSPTWRSSATRGSGAATTR